MAPKRKARDITVLEEQVPDVGDPRVRGDQADWAGYTVAQLKWRLVARGLPVSGKKAHLVARLKAHDGKPPIATTAEVQSGVDQITLGNNAVPQRIARDLPVSVEKANRVAHHQAGTANALVAPAQTASDDKLDEIVKWKSKTVSQLKSELATRGHAVSGKKADLVARLEAYDNGEPVEAGLVKRAKKSKGPQAEVLIDGPLAADVVVHKSGKLPDVILPPSTFRRLQDNLYPIRPRCCTQSVRTLTSYAANYETGERRTRNFIAAPDDKFKATFWRITNERMFMLDRRTNKDRNGYACQEFDIAGSTGNIYHVKIGRSSPTCTCPDAKFRENKCKHINYALIVILKAPVYLQYQLAFMSDELESIFANAPVTRALDEHDHDEDAESLTDGKRKPIDGDCSICVFPMIEGEEELVWCKAACGQNFHADCFAQWKNSKRGGKVTCVYCRTEWEEEGKKKGPLASLVSRAPIVGFYRNIGHHEMYRREPGQT